MNQFITDLRRTVFALCITIIALLIAPLSAHAAQSQPVTSGRAIVQLVSNVDSVSVGEDFTLALSFRLEPHWHTYWRNAGGPGMPVALHWSNADALNLGEIIWPIPQIVHTGPIVNYAFEDKLLLPMSAKLMQDAQVGDTILIEVEAAYLVCYQVCLPESAKLSLPLTIGPREVDNRWNDNIKRALRRAPSDNTAINAAFQYQHGDENSTFALSIADANLSAKLQNGTARNVAIFPYVQDLINADKPQTIAIHENGIATTLEAGWIAKQTYGPKAEQADSPQTLLLAYEINQEGKWKPFGEIITAEANANVPLGQAINASQTNAATPSGFGFWAAVFSALIGGLILNLMPCVFPVLSLKALGLARSAHDPKILRRHGWLYTAGCIVMFMTLAGLLLLLKAGGAAIGWGFQLQNPILVSVMALLFFVIALNLFGVFEFGGRAVSKLQNIGSDTLNPKHENRAAFLTGVLAVIVATPCTAPFMAGALGFALAQSALISLIVFLSLAIGFAAPFLILSYSPKLLSKLPKPGPWMDVFKQALGFPMIMAFIWLIWVLSSLGGNEAVIKTLLTATGIWFLIWSWRFKPILVRAISFIVLLFTVWGIFSISSIQETPTNSPHEQAQTWSPERVAELRAAGHTVFVDFTARWCVSCKVNETLILNTSRAKKLYARTNTKVLIADWTRKDDIIAAELARHGRSGVPLYLVYPAGTTPVSPIILPQTLTFKSLTGALEQASK